jgi:hypothetical protein
VRATRIAEPIVLNGALDERVDRHEAPVDGFVQQ